MDQQPFQSELVRIERNPWIMGVGALPFLGTLALVVAGLFNARWLLGLPHPTFLGVYTTVYLWRKNLSPVIRPMLVRAGAEGVTIGDRFVPRSKIRAGFLKPGAAVYLTARKGDDGSLAAVRIVAEKDGVKPPM